VKDSICNRQGDGRSCPLKSQEPDLGESRKESLAGVQEVELSLLVENAEVREAIGRLFKTTDHGDFVSRHPRGLGSVFDVAYRWSAGFVQPGAQSGTVELETTIFFREAFDLRIHSVFRVEEPPI
jgi:hypothetical protein